MTKRLVFGTLTLAAVLAVGSCKDDVGLTSVPTEVENFTAQLSGANENPQRTTSATGTATISVVGGVVLYRIDVTGITNVTAAHIHAPNVAGMNAGVVLNLCGTGAPAPACVSGTGVLATGVAAPNATVSFTSLLRWLRTDSAYVNVHTDDGVAPANTGAGDFPGGEIRGQIAKQ
jgi:hypothetical protein